MDTRIRYYRNTTRPKRVVLETQCLHDELILQRLIDAFETNKEVVIKNSPTEGEEFFFSFKKGAY